MSTSIQRDTLRCWAVGIDEVRDIFAADDGLRSRLLTSAEPLLGDVVPPVPRPGLLAKLGPLLRHPPQAPVVSDPTAPRRADAENLLRAQFVPEPRLGASWALVRHWLDELAWESGGWQLDDRDLDTLDFDLARAGVSAHHGVRHLWGRDARLGLRPEPGWRLGYIRHDNALALAADWQRALPELTGASERTATEVVAFLNRLLPYAETATGAGRPTPDVVTLTCARG